jgi:phage terminase large subunit-like protein
MQWSTACPDWESRIVARQPLILAPPLYPDEAAKARQIFRQLPIVDVAGSPVMGEICRDWAQELVDVIFGAYDHAIGRRLITEFFCCVAKKNAKSTIAAGVMMTALLRNWRQSAEFLILAPTIEIANNSYYPARDMVRADPELSELLHVQDHVRTITHRATRATLKVVAADNETVGGKKATAILIDELWLFGKRPNAENMLREATGGLASRPEGFVVYLSTESDEPPAGVFKQKLQYARDVRDGRIVDPQFLPLIYEYPPAMIEARQHLEPEYFYIPNPNLGASVDDAYLRREFTKAQNDGAESLCGFLAKHLNVEIGLALRSDRWVGADFWAGALDRTLTLDELIRRSDVVEVGIDGGGLDDMLGVSAVGREESTGAWLVWTHAWVHPIVLERRKSEASKFRDFERDGDLTIVEEIGQDVQQVAEIVARIDAAGVLDRVGVDQAGIGTIVDAIVAQDIAADRIVGISQGWRLFGAIKSAERFLAEGKLRHGGQPLMAWCVANAKVEPRGNAIIITKQLAGAAKIDPLMALFNAVTLMSQNPESRRKAYPIYIM